MLGCLLDGSESHHPGHVPVHTQHWWQAGHAAGSLFRKLSVNPGKAYLMVTFNIVGFLERKASLPSLGMLKDAGASSSRCQGNSFVSHPSYLHQLCCGSRWHETLPKLLRGSPLTEHRWVMESFLNYFMSLLILKQIRVTMTFTPMYFIMPPRKIIIMFPTVTIMSLSQFTKLSVIS